MEKEEKKYTMTDDTIVLDGVKLSRIQALRDFGNVKAGELGGYISCEENLSHNGTCWVSDNAFVCDYAIVMDDALVSDRAIVCDDALVRDRSIVRDFALVSERAIVRDSAQVRDRSIVCGEAIVRERAIVMDDAIVREQSIVSGGAHVGGSARVGDVEIVKW
jgi:carbonic anhydrase/acetyltransferase-like protein (isoleucine patch superfamily)